MAFKPVTVQAHRMAAKVIEQPQTLSDCCEVLSERPIGSKDSRIGDLLVSVC